VRADFVLMWVFFGFGFGFLFFLLASSLENFVVVVVLGLWRLHKPLLCHEGSGSGSSSSASSGLVVLS
jgi:hypothetical protein